MEVHRNSEMATVGCAGAKLEVSVELLDTVSVGDYVLIDVGFAVAKINAEEAETTLAKIADGGVSSADSGILAA